MTQGALLLQDNAPAHTSQAAMAAATKGSFNVLPQPPYSPDLVPLNFYLFPNLKTNLCCKNFGSNEGIINAVDEYLGDWDGLYLERISGTVLESASRQRENILRNNGTISALGHSQSTGAENFLVIPRI